MTEQLVGASVLPVMLDPLYGMLYFLLAKERYHPSWPEGSNLWTSFGGGQEPGETAEQTAAREFVEESMGQVQFFEGEVLPRTSFDDIAAALQKGQYVLQFSHVYNNTRFVMFVVQVPWDPSVSARFFSARAAYVAGGQNIQDCCLEKSNIGLFSVPQIVAASRHKGYLSPQQRCCTVLSDALAVLLPELQFHFPNLF